MEEVEREFLKFARQGVILSAQDLAKFAARKKIAVPPREKLRGLRHNWKALAAHARIIRPQHHMGTAYPRYGVLFVDLAVYRPDLKRFNDGFGAMLVAQEKVSQKLSVVLLKDKTSESWRNGILVMLDRSYGALTTVVSDRDAAVTSAKFREAVQKQYGIRWSFLLTRSKSFMAERSIRFVKERLSQALALTKSRRWVDNVAKIVADYNSRPVTGTNVRRSSVNKNNYPHLLQQTTGLEDPTALFNLGDSSNFSEKLGNRLFKFKLEDTVLLSREANYLLKPNEKGIFVKPSMQGAFGPIVYRVVQRTLKNTARQFLTPVYKLRALDRKQKDPQGFFYERELSKTPAFTG